MLIPRHQLSQVGAVLSSLDLGWEGWASLTPHCKPSPRWPSVSFWTNYYKAQKQPSCTILPFKGKNPMVVQSLLEEQTLLATCPSSSTRGTGAHSHLLVPGSVCSHGSSSPSPSFFGKPLEIERNNNENSKFFEVVLFPGYLSHVCKHVHVCTNMCRRGITQSISTAASRYF